MPAEIDPEALERATRAVYEMLHGPVPERPDTLATDGLAFSRALAETALKAATAPQPR